MSKYRYFISGMVALYEKNILFVLLFCLIAIGITGLLFFIPTTIIRGVLVAIWWSFSLSVMIESLAKYKHKKKEV